MIPTIYSEKYFANTPTASMVKLPLVAEAVTTNGYGKLIEPSSIDGIQNKLKKIHNIDYVNAFDQGIRPLCDSNGWDWTEEIRDGVYHINQGQIDAAKLALENGISANIAQGFHHSGPESGCGFCSFNGLALVASEFPNLKVFVLDCDEHGGNGTAQFTEFMTNFAQVTINGCNFGTIENERTICYTLGKITEKYETYQNHLELAFEIIEDYKPDLIIYQAGADPHIDDPLGSLGMTTEQMRARDNYVFSQTKNLNIPTMFVLAGGYQVPIKELLVPLHLNTFKEACKVYNKN